MRVQARHSPRPLWGRGAGVRGTAERPHSFRASLSNAPPRPQSLSPRGGEGTCFREHHGTLAREQGRLCFAPGGGGGPPLRKNKDQDAVVLGIDGRDVASIFTSPNAGRSLRLTPHLLQGQMKRVGGNSRSKPPTRNAFAALRHLDLPALGEVKGSATLRASTPPREPFPRGGSGVVDANPCELTSSLKGWWKH